MTPYPILVVDDDPTILDLIAQVLLEEGYDVLTSSDGSAALSVASERLPKLILLDLMMPQMNGWQVVGELKASSRTRAIPILLLSARRDVAKTASELGVTAYLEKPFDIEELLGCVQNILRLTTPSAT
jgi:DNA-binding response OmpR family regulator